MAHRGKLAMRSHLLYLLLCRTNFRLVGSQTYVHCGVSARFDALQPTIPVAAAVGGTIALFLPVEFFAPFFSSV